MHDPLVLGLGEALGDLADDVEPLGRADLPDLHAGIAPDQIAEHALVVRGKVLHKHKGHIGIGIGGHGGEKGFEGRQPPG